jgi:pimeloyl-ACP methyl ester carboxylesterase
MTPGAVEQMEAQLPGFRGHMLLPGIGHWTQQEDPEAFDTALLEFLASLD